jgi:fumarate reductase subunit D
MDGLLIVFTVAGLGALFLIGLVKYSDWKAAHRHHHR